MQQGIPGCEKTIGAAHEPSRKVGSRIARHTFFNLGGHSLAAAAGILSIPYVARGLGGERFAILSIVWALFSYFSTFDFGLSSATTKCVSEHIAQEKAAELSRLFWTSLMLHLVLACMGALLIGVLGPVLVRSLLAVHATQYAEASAAFLLTAAAIPALVVGSGLRGVLEGAQRFDLTNLVRTPANASLFLLSAAGVALGLDLVGITALLLAARCVAAIAYFVFCLKVLGGLRPFAVHGTTVRALLSFGAWVTVTAVVAPFLTYMDRFAIAGLLPLASVAHYSAPYDAITRVAVIPLSLTAALFPTFSALAASRIDDVRIDRIYARSIIIVFLTFGPLMTVAVTFGPALAQVWLGPDFPSATGRVLQILSVGVLINSLALVPFTFLYGMGRPDLPAKFHTVELPIHIFLLVLLIQKFGIVGAALAWGIRATLDTLLLLAAATRVRPSSARALYESGLLRTVLAVLAFAICFPLAVFTSSGHSRFYLASFVTIIFIVFAWRCLVDARERVTLISAVREVLRFGK